MNNGNGLTTRGEKSIDEETYRRQQQAKQGRRKIRQKGTNDDFALAVGININNGRFMYTFIEGERKGQILWEEQVEIKTKEMK